MAVGPGPACCHVDYHEGDGCREGEEREDEDDKIYGWAVIARLLFPNDKGMKIDQLLDLVGCVFSCVLCISLATNTRPGSGRDEISGQTYMFVNVIYKYIFTLF
ncbi:hypothetical protein V2J09_003859 [Rumex salicifolius]